MSKDSVFGYIRNHEKQKSVTVPNLVKYLCLQYYMINERFTVHSGGVTLSNDQRTAELLLDQQSLCGHAMGTAYGDINVLSKDDSALQYQWTFKFPDLVKSNWNEFNIGIANGSGKKKCSTSWRDSLRLHFGYNTRTQEMDVWGLMEDYHAHYAFDPKSDCIDMVFNPRTMDLSFQLNNAEIIKANIKCWLRDAPEAYMTVSMLRGNNVFSCELVHFGVRDEEPEDIYRLKHNSFLRYFMDALSDI